MSALGPVVGLALVFGGVGFALGYVISQVLRRYVGNLRRGRQIAIWLWVGIVGVGGVAASIWGVSSEPPDPLGVAVLAFLLWVVAVNTLSGALTISARARPQAT
jgi:uncharacterized membrane protein